MPRLLWLPLLLGLAAGCSCEDAGAGGELTLVLYAGAGLRPVVEPLAAAFTRRTGIGVAANYGGSGRLLGQISALRKGDLFMPGAEFYVDIAVEKGLAAGDSKRTVAYFVPVIFVEKGNPKAVKGLADLARPGLRLGFGDERACAVGRKTLRILEKAGMPYERLAANVVFKSGTVSELAVAVKMKTVDAVIIWDATARQFGEYGEMIPIPARVNDISTVPIARLLSSEHPAEAERFIRFVTSPEGRELLARGGYTVSLQSPEETR